MRNDNVLGSEDDEDSPLQDVNIENILNSFYCHVSIVGILASGRSISCHPHHLSLIRQVNFKTHLHILFLLFPGDLHDFFTSCLPPYCLLTNNSHLFRFHLYAFVTQYHFQCSCKLQFLNSGCAAFVCIDPYAKVVGFCGILIAVIPRW